MEEPREYRSNLDLAAAYSHEQIIRRQAQMQLAAAQELMRKAISARARNYDKPPMNRVLAERVFLIGETAAIELCRQLDLPPFKAPKGEKVR